MDQPKSVLLLIADDWSPLAGCFGSPVIQTPHVNALASRATRFSNAFCTSPSCAASRANILTGHYSHTHGQYGHSHSIHNFHTAATMPSIPKQLGAAGYATGIIGKLHTQPQSVYPWTHDLQKVSGGPRNVPKIAEVAAGFFNDIGDQPFYLHMGFTDPHRDFGNKQTYEGVDETFYDAATVPVPDFLPDHPSVRAELADYYQSISRLDLGYGLAIKALEAAGRAEDTMIVVMSDHGMPFPGAKASSFDSGHHCPLLIARPGADEVENDALVNWSNIAPTVFDWCGVEPPEGLPERSLLPILDDTHPEGWEETFFSHTFHEVTNYYPYRALRGRKYKYVRNLYPELTRPLPSDLYASPTWKAVIDDDLQMMGRRPTAQFLHQRGEALFDIEDDPVESTNLIDEPHLQDVAEQMRAKVKRFRVETRDPWVLASRQFGEEGFEETRPPQ
ncbi:MAG: sulfatase [Candidatus Latescibacterota bacterium]|nr:sulfatase [Candidatus Latescibacterota bacterium]